MLPKSPRGAKRKVRHVDALRNLDPHASWPDRITGPFLELKSIDQGGDDGLSPSMAAYLPPFPSDDSEMMADFRPAADLLGYTIEVAELENMDVEVVHAERAIFIDHRASLAMALQAGIALGQKYQAA